MKKMIFLLLASAVCFASEDYKIITLQDIVKTGAFQEMDLSENIPFQNYVNETSSNVVLVNKGTKLSLNFFLKGDCFHFNTSQLPYITIEKDLYFRKEKKHMLYSTDLVNWNKSYKFFNSKPLIDIRENNDDAIGINVGASIDQN